MMLVNDDDNHDVDGVSIYILDREVRLTKYPNLIPEGMMNGIQVCFFFSYGNDLHIHNSHK